MPGLGAILRQARLAKDLSLEDVERETRIAQRYLDALENEDVEALPAPVYARGFVRNYARFLGLNADELLEQFPLSAAPEQPESGSFAAGMSLDRPASDRMEAGGTRVLPILVGGLVVGALLLAVVYGITAVRDDGPAPAEITSAQPQDGTNADGGRVLPIDAPTADAQPRTVDAPEVQAGSGEVPDFRGRDVASVLTNLRQLGIPYLVVEMESERLDPGKVLQQTPRPGVRIDKKTSVTLVVSRRGNEPEVTTTSPTPTPTPTP